MIKKHLSPLILKTPFLPHNLDDLFFISESYKSHRIDLDGEFAGFRYPCLSGIYIVICFSVLPAFPLFILFALSVQHLVHTTLT